MIRQTAYYFYKSLFEETDPDGLRRKFLGLLLEIQGVDRGSIWVRDTTGLLCVEAAGKGSESIKGMTLEADQPSIVGWVMANGRMTIAEAGKDQRHSKQVETGLEVKSNLILCFPLILRDDTVYGAVQLIDTSAEGDRLNLDRDYLQDLQEMIDLGSIALSNALDLNSRETENDRLRKRLKELQTPDTVIGRTEPFLAALTTARNYSRTDFPVLITGESGTGKEVFAHQIHSQSDRNEKPLLIQNCSSIPDELLESELFGYRKGSFTGAVKDKTGLIEAADGGTVFLDEIGDMPLHLQAKILRVIQEGEIKPLGENKTRKVDIRLISATNRDLAQMISDGQFREDLYYRLNVLPLELPPLRRRRDDIPLLINYFLKKESNRLGLPTKNITASAMVELSGHDWPGNIRELENLVKYLLAVVEGLSIDLDSLPDHISRARSEISTGAAPVPEQRAVHHPLTGDGEDPGSGPDLSGYTWLDLETAYVRELLERTRWNVTKAADLAGVNRSTFSSRMRRLKIRRDS